MPCNCPRGDGTTTCPREDICQVIGALGSAVLDLRDCDETQGAVIRLLRLLTEEVAGLLDREIDRALADQRA